MAVTRRIWVPREPPAGMDVGLAEEHGFLMPPVFSRSMPPLDVKRQEDLVREQVLPLAKAEDLLLVVGPQVSSAVLVAAFTIAFGGARLLLWDGSCSRYREARVGFYGIPRGAGGMPGAA